MEDLQKENEKLHIELNMVTGNRNYWQKQAGTYRQANHSNLLKIRRYKVIIAAEAAVILTQLLIKIFV